MAVQAAVQATLRVRIEECFRLARAIEIRVHSIASEIDGTTSPPEQAPPSQGLDSMLADVAAVLRNVDIKVEAIANAIGQSGPMKPPTSIR